MLTYAVDDRTSFRNLRVWRDEFRKYADIKDGTTFPFIVVANKVIYCTQSYGLLFSISKIISTIL